ncbi:DNA-directed RNA polymerase 7 kDa subunit, partial [Monkeypox virus]
TVQPLLDIN